MRNKLAFIYLINEAHLELKHQLSRWLRWLSTLFIFKYTLLLNRSLQVFMLALTLYSSSDSRVDPNSNLCTKTNPLIRTSTTAPSLPSIPIPSSRKASTLYHYPRFPPLKLPIRNCSYSIPNLYYCFTTFILSFHTWLISTFISLSSLIPHLSIRLSLAIFTPSPILIHLSSIVFFDHITFLETLIIVL